MSSSSGEPETIMFMRLVESCHTLLRKGTGGMVDMDRIQAYVYKTLPPFTKDAMFAAVIGSMILWAIVFFFLHFYAI